MRHVAARAGVSIMTVSNVVNRRFHLVHHDTQARVEAAIAELNYRPGTSGRQLRLNRHFAIGMLVVDPLATFLAEPFISQVVAGLTNFMSESSVGCLIQGVKPDKFSDNIFLQSAMTDGLCVFLCGTDHERIAMMDALLSQGEPVVAIEETLPHRDHNLCLVGQDDFGGGITAVEHLLERGCRTLLVPMPSMQWPSVSERMRGMLHALSHHGLEDSLTTVECGNGTASETRAAVLGCLRSGLRTDSIIAMTHRLGSGVFSALAEAGILVPQQMRVVVFNVMEITGDLKDGASSVVSRPYQIGREAGAALLAHAESGKFPTPRIKLPLTFIEGNTS